MAIFDVFDFSGKKISTADLNDAVFGAVIKPYLHTEVVNWQRACKRSGTQSAMTKGEVSGTTKKPFKQKGTGSARQGSLKNPHQIGGGVAFAPKPRDYSYVLPKSKKRAALASVLSLRLKEGRLRFLDALALDAPKTKHVAQLLANFGMSSCLVIDSENNNLKLSARNHAELKFLEEKGANVLDILKFPYLLITVDAAKKIEERLIG